MGMAVLGVIVLVAIFGIVALIIGRKSWRWLHNMFAFLAMAAVIGVFILGAMVAKVHLSWKELVFAYEPAVSKADTSVREVARGKDTDIDPDAASLANMNEILWRAVFDRGRVWRGATITNVAPNQMTVNLPAPAVVPDPAAAPPDPAAAPAAPAAAAPPENQLAEKDIVYVFLQQEDPTTGWNLPVAYLGEFSITATTPSSVTLQPSLPLAPAQAGLIQNGRVLAIYDKMPADSHQAFTQDFTSGPQTEGDDFYLFGKTLERDQLMAMFPKAQMNVDDAEYEKLIDSYRFDGWAVERIKNVTQGEAGRIAPFDPAPEETWLRVKITKAMTKDNGRAIEVDGELAAGTPLDTDTYDLSGRAQVYPLSQGVLLDSGGTPVAGQRRTQGNWDSTTWDKTQKGYVEFKPDDEAVFDQVAGTQLINDGFAELIEPIYVRRLHDYRFNFHHIHRRINDLVDKIATTEGEIRITQGAKDNVDKQIASRQSEKNKLEEDLANFQSELATVSTHRDQLDAELTEKKAKIVQLYRETKYYESQIAVLHAKLNEEIEKRVREAVAENP